MNHLVFLNAQAGELEKILSGVKTILIQECDPAQTTAPPVCPGDSLYFLKKTDECTIRVRATVVRVLFLTGQLDKDLSHTLKEMQPGLQLTEEQFSYWSRRDQALFVELDSAQKIPMIHVAPEKIKERSSWIAFEEFSLITEYKGSDENQT